MTDSEIQTMRSLKRTYGVRFMRWEPRAIDYIDDTVEFDTDFTAEQPLEEIMTAVMVDVMNQFNEFVNNNFYENVTVLSSYERLREE